MCGYTLISVRCTARSCDRSTGVRIDRWPPRRYCFGRRQISGMPPFRPENARIGCVARTISPRRNANAQAPCPIGGRDRGIFPCDGACRRCSAGREARGADRRQFQLPDRSATAQSVAGCERRRKNVQGCGLRHRRYPDQCRQSRIQARDPQVRSHRRPGRYRRRLLRRPRPRDRRHQLSHSDRCAARQRPRCRRRGDPAGAAGVVGGWRQTPAADHSRCLPRQSLRHGRCAASARPPAARWWRASARSSRPAPTR